MRICYHESELRNCGDIVSLKYQSHLYQCTFGSKYNKSTFISPTPLDFRTTVTLLVCSQASSVCRSVESGFEVKSVGCKCVRCSHAVFVKIQGFWYVTLRPFVRHRRSFEGQYPFRHHTAVPRTRRCYVRSERRKLIEKVTRRHIPQDSDHENGALVG